MDWVSGFVPRKFLWGRGGSIKLSFKLRIAVVNALCTRASFFSGCSVSVLARASRPGP